MTLFPTWPITAGALVVGLVAGAYADHTVMSARIDKAKAYASEQLRQREVVRAQDERIARTREQEITESLTRTLQDKENEKDRIAVERDRAVASLQDRANRKPASPGAAAAVAADCKGSTGAELSRPDAEFLTGFAARADTVRAALSQCYAQYDAAREVVNRQGVTAPSTSQ